MQDILIDESAEQLHLHIDESTKSIIYLKISLLKATTATEQSIEILYL